MIKAIEIKNFQSHKSTVIEFHPGMNVITGSSDFGKSAIIRAILWGINNRPSGESFKSWSADEEDSVEVAMEFDNGWFIKKREKGKNVYICDEGKFEALRGNVPDAISNIANVTDYNVQTQYNPYFMLQDSPGDRAKKINQLVGLDIIDKVFKNLNRKITLTRNEVTRLTTVISTLTEEIESMEYLTEITPKINKLDDDIHKYEENSYRADLLVSHINKLTANDTEAAKYSKILTIEPKYKSLIKKITDYQTKETSVIKLNTAIQTLTKIDSDIQADQDWLAVEKPFIALKEKINKFKEDTARLRQLQILIKDLHVIDYGLEEENRKLIIAQEDYNKVLQEAKICPACGKPL